MTGDVVRGIQNGALVEGVHVRPGEAEAPFTRVELLTLQALIRRAPGLFVEKAASLEQTLGRIDLKIMRLLGVIACAHCREGEARPPVGLCRACSAYERKMGRLPAPDVLRRRVRNGDGRRTG